MGSARGGSDSGLEAVEVKAPAKVNFHLRVLARRTSGFHCLETVFCAVGLHDGIRLERTGHAGRVELETEGATDLDATPEANLAYRAATVYLERAGVAAGGAGIRIRLRKGIPAGAGLGGGSADAAFVLRGLETLLGGALGRDALLELGASLGSDVPFFLAPRPFALAWGRGERVLPLQPPPSAPLVLALPSLAVSTSWAFGELARVRDEAARAAAGKREREGDGDRPPDRPGILPEALAGGGWAPFAVGAGGTAGGGFPGNDFEQVVFRHHPELARVREALEAAGARLARLTGSGAALFGVFGTAEEADQVARTLEGRFEGVRWVSTRTLETFPEPEGAAD